jgi:hypothetical protein
VRSRSHTRPLRFAVLALSAAALFSCRYTPTEVLVTLGTDAPLGRELSIRVFLFRGDANSSQGAPAHVFTRGGASSDTTLPASFALVPDGEPRNQSVLLRIEARLAADSGAPAQSFRRTARFAFIPRAIGSLPIYLATSCGNPANGCTSVAADACTVSVRCEDMGATCGDRGECVAIDTMPIPIATPTLDASFDFGPAPNDAREVSIDAVDADFYVYFGSERADDHAESAHRLTRRCEHAIRGRDLERR